MYQSDIMEEFNRQSEIIFYGPGFKGFDPREKIKNVINKVGGADILIVGHAWLNDNPGNNIDSFPELDLEDTSIPKFVILNKEYTNLHAKLKWIREKNFLHGFSHHHNVKFYSDYTKIPFMFTPFAFNEHIFNKNYNLSKDIDFSFSGILKNSLPDTDQTDTRIIVMKKLFHCFGDIPIIKKLPYTKYKFFWNTIPRNFFMYGFAKVLNKYRRLNNKEYALMIMRSKAYLNTLSPLGIISPRFFENIASKTLIFCEETDHLKRIFPSECYITFKSNFSDFDEKFKFAVSDGVERDKIIKHAFDIAFTKHTWRSRVNSIMEVIKERLN